MSESARCLESPTRFDRFVLDPRRRRLLRSGKAVALSAKTLDLLVILLAHDGEAVSRERLYDLLWPCAFVEDGNLTQHVHLLRRTLDPSGDGRRFIQTIPRRGYRFAMPLKAVVHPRLRHTYHHVFVRAALAVLTSAILLVTGSAVQSTTVPLSLDARVSYDLGVYHWNMRTDPELDRSITYFRQTIARAPQSALGYAGLAAAYTIKADGSKDGTPLSKRYVHLAQAYRDAALLRDPDSAQANTITAFIAYRFEHDFARAGRAFTLALARDPNYATAHHWHAVFSFAQGRLGEATREWELAHQLEPTSEVISRWLGTAYVYGHRPSDAVRVLGETLSIEPADHEAWLELASAQEQLGDFRHALMSLATVRRNTPHKASFIHVRELRIKVVAHHGIVDAATLSEVQRAAKANPAGEWTIATVLAALGRRDQALALLKTARPHSALDLAMLRNDPNLDSLRRDPRFRKMLG